MADRVAPKKQNVNRKSVSGKTQIGSRTVTKNGSADADEKTKKKTMKEERSMVSKTNDRREKDGILTNKREQEKKPKKDKEKGAQKQKQEQDQQEYEDDFEQYESDFEEEEVEVEEKTVESTHGNRDNDEEDPAKESVLLRRVVENQFVASAGTIDRKDTLAGNHSENFLIEQRELAIHSNKKEGHQVIHSELTEPKNDHLTDIFMELIGKREIRKRAHTQTCGAELNVASQTQMKETESRGIQHNSYLQHNQREDTQQLMATKEKDRKTGKRIGTFMKAAEQLMINLLNLTEASAEDRSILQNNSNLSFTSRYSVFSFQALFTEGRFCAFTAKEQNQLTIAIAVFIPSSDLRSRKSLIVEVPLDNFGAKPRRFLCCEQEVVACRYSYDGSALFAGLKDGSIVAWNLHSDGCQFGQFFNDTLFSKSESAGISVIFPCFDTASLLLLDGKKVDDNRNKKQRKNNTKDNEMSTAIVAMEILDEKTVGVLAQLVVLRESGIIQRWTAFDNDYRHQNGKLNNLSGLEERTIKLIHVTSFQCFGRQEIRYSATCLLVLPIEQFNHFLLIGTSSGRIIKLNKIVREDGRKEYKTIDEDPEEIVCLKACPLKQTIFAAATSGQNILLYSSAIYTPLRILTQRNSQIFSFPLLFEWFPSNQSSALFLTTMNEGDKILLWRYQTASGFFEREECDFRSEFRAKIINVAIWKSHTDNSFLALCLSNGQVQVHSLEVRGKNDPNILTRSIEAIENDCFISSCIV